VPCSGPLTPAAAPAAKLAKRPQTNGKTTFGKYFKISAVITRYRRAAAMVCLRPSPPPRGPKHLPPPSRRQRSSTFPRLARSHANRCSRLTCQHGGEQSGLVTLTSDLLTLKVVSESLVTWATYVPILVFLGLSVLDLGPMYATDRRQTDRQTTSDKSIA